MHVTPQTVSTIIINVSFVTQIAGLRFVFLVNQELISAIRQEAVKVTIPV